MRDHVPGAWVNGERSPREGGHAKFHLKSLCVVHPERCHQSPFFRVTPLHCAKVVYPGGMCQEFLWFLAAPRQYRNPVLPHSARVNQRAQPLRWWAGVLTNLSPGPKSQRQAET
jgi:hypothetical protein